MMKFIATLGVAALCVAGLGAQSAQTETKSKITVKDGKSMTVTGCVASSANGTGFVLTNVADKTGALHDYILVSADSELSKQIGHRVQISGKATDRGDGKVKVETKSKTKVEGGDDKETHSQAEVKNDTNGMPYFGVDSVKMIAAACP